MMEVVCHFVLDLSLASLCAVVDMTEFEDDDSTLETRGCKVKPYDGKE